MKRTTKIVSILLITIALFFVFILGVVSYIGYRQYTESNSILQHLGLGQFSKRNAKDYILSTADSWLQLNEEDAALLASVLNKECDRIDKEGVDDKRKLEKDIDASLQILKPIIKSERTKDQITYFYNMANLEHKSTLIYTDVKKIVDDWCLKNLSFSEKIRIIQFSLDETLSFAEIGVDNDNAAKAKYELYSKVGSILKSDIQYVVSKEKEITSEQYKAMVEKSLSELGSMNLETDGENITLIILVPRTYYNISEILDCDIEQLLTDWYLEKSKITPPTFNELAIHINKWASVMEEAHMVSKIERARIEKIVNADIELFRTSSDTTILRKTAINNLKKLERIVGDTEDRETLAEFYYNLAANRNIGIGRDLEVWMYGEELAKLSDKMDISKKTWER